MDKDRLKNLEAKRRKRLEHDIEHLRQREREPQQKLYDMERNEKEREELVREDCQRKAAFDWIVEVKKPEATFAALGDVGQHESLDGKLSAALTKVMTG